MWGFRALPQKIFEIIMRFILVHFDSYRKLSTIADDWCILTGDPIIIYRRFSAYPTGRPQTRFCGHWSSNVSAGEAVLCHLAFSARG